MRVLKSTNRYLEDISLTRDHMLCLHYSSSRFEAEIYQSKAVLWKIKEPRWDAIDVADSAILDNPPVNVVISHSLSGTKFAYALSTSCVIRIVEVSEAEDVLVAVMEINTLGIGRTMLNPVREMCLVNNLLLYQLYQGNGNIKMKELTENGAADLPELELESRASNISMTEFGLVAACPRTKSAIVWNLSDLIRRPDASSGTVMHLEHRSSDISFGKKNSVVLCNNGVLFVDKLLQGFYGFYFKDPNKGTGMMLSEYLDELL